MSYVFEFFDLTSNIEQIQKCMNINKESRNLPEFRYIIILHKEYKLRIQVTWPIHNNIMTKCIVKGSLPVKSTSV